MNRALISDIHGNLEALEAVLADIQSQDITDVYCLGDVVGYGPNPRECVDLGLRQLPLGRHAIFWVVARDAFDKFARRAFAGEDCFRFQQILAELFD